MDKNPSRDRDQLQVFFLVFLRALWALPLSLALAFLLALAVVFWRTPPPQSYQSQALLALRAPGYFEVQYPEQESFVIQNTRRPESPTFLPAPFSASEIADLATSSEVLGRTAATLNERGNGRNYTAASLAGKLSATARLELKTPYEVRYSALITLRSVDSTPDGANLVCAEWAKATTEYVTQYYARERDHVLKELSRVYTTLRTNTAAKLADAPDVLMAEIDVPLTKVLAALHLQATLASETSVAELVILSPPGDSVAGEQHRELQLFIFWFIGAFVCLYLFFIFAQLLKDARKKLSR